MDGWVELSLLVGAVEELSRSAPGWLLSWPQVALSDPSPAPSVLVQAAQHDWALP